MLVFLHFVFFCNFIPSKVVSSLVNSQLDLRVSVASNGLLGRQHGLVVGETFLRLLVLQLRLRRLVTLQVRLLVVHFVVVSGVSAHDRHRSVLVLLVCVCVVLILGQETAMSRVVGCLRLVLPVQGRLHVLVVPLVEFLRGLHLLPVLVLAVIDIVLHVVQPALHRVEHRGIPRILGLPRHRFPPKSRFLCATFC